MTDVLYCGLDVGISTTDAVGEWDDRASVSLSTGEPEESATEALRELLKHTPPPREAPLRIAATGIGAGRLPERLLGGTVKAVDEMLAIGTGGTRLADRTEGLVVSFGTGTTLVSVSPEGIRQILPGSGVGGGTLAGMARLLFGQDVELDVLSEWARRGDRRRLDFIVGDLSTGPVGSLPSHATASNFGKAASGARREDVAAALANLVAESALWTALLGWQASGRSGMIFTGKLLLFEPVRSRIESILGPFPGSWTIPKRFALATALGALCALREEERKARS